MVPLIALCTSVRFVVLDEFAVVFADGLDFGVSEMEMHGISMPTFEFHVIEQSLV